MNHHFCKRLCIRFVVLGAVLFPLWPAWGNPGSDKAFTALVDRYFDAMFKTDPVRGTWAGFHEYDSALPKCDRKDFELQITQLKAFRNQFANYSKKVLSTQNALDREFIQARIESSILSLSVFKSYETDPDYYPGLINESIYLLLNRDFAPIDVRLASLLMREHKAIEQLQCARKNLVNPPRIYTEIALEQLPAIRRFFEKDVPTAVAHASATLLREFEVENGRLIAALNDYEEFLRKDLLPRSHGEYRIGEANFLRKLKFDEMIESSTRELLEVGMKDLRANQALFVSVGQEIDPNKTTAEILSDLEKDHPSADKLLATIRSLLGGLREFIVERKLISLPFDTDPIVQETPPFKRATTFASMNAPGPYETQSTEAYYNVTLPDPSWTQEQIEEHLRGYNHGTLVSTSIHEAYPGHYTQFMHFKSAPSKTRKLLSAKSNKEGWAHYVEQMMLDEGYGGSDKRLKLGQLQDALLRNARFIVAIRMHTQGMSFDDAVEFFMKEGFQNRSNAIREAKRGTYDPTYLVYTLGKLEILKLREDYRRIVGQAFKLGLFHDAFVAEGAPPIPLVRRALLGTPGNPMQSVPGTHAALP